MRRLCRAATVVVLAAATLAATEAGPEVPAICTAGVPELADGEVLVERTLWFHGEQASGTPGQVSNFPLGYDPAKTMDEEAPTGEQPKLDVLFGVGLNNAFVGGPTLPYWRAMLDDEPRIVCARADFYAEIPGNAEVRLFADESYATGGTTARADAAPTGEDGSLAGWAADFGALDVQVWELVVQVSHVSSISPRDAGVVGYDSTGAPSALRIVTVEPAPGA